MSEARDACQESGGGDRRQNRHERPDGVACPGRVRRPRNTAASLSGTIIQDWREWSGVELHHVSLTLAREVVAPRLHQRPAPIKQIAPKICAFNAPHRVS